MPLEAITQREGRAWVTSPTAWLPGAGVLGADGGLRIGELAGLRRSRVDLVDGLVDVAETVVVVVVVVVEGRLLVGPPKTGAGRRRSGLPRRVVDELAAGDAGGGSAGAAHP